MTIDLPTSSRSGADDNAIDREVDDAAARLAGVLAAVTAANDQAHLREVVHFAIHVLKQAAAPAP